MEQTVSSTINLLQKLREVPDPRRRQGKIYPLSSLLAMLILAALNGESSLRGMVEWGRQHWRQLQRALGFKLGSSAPVYGTVWTVLAAVPAAELAQVLDIWGTKAVLGDTEAIAIDGKSLRGSKRRASQLAALQIVSAAAQEIGLVIGQQEAVGADSISATVQLLQQLPLDGKVVTLDAGLLQQEVATPILQKGGPIWAP